MDELTIVDERAEERLGSQDGGSTFVLGAEGWESVDFMDPEDDWSLQVDGSYLSPDGAIRSWPLIGPEPL